MEPAANLSVDAPAVRERTGRRSTSGAPRAARHDRVVDRRTALSSLAAELSAAAATIEADMPAASSVLTLVAEPEPAPAPAVPLVLERLASLDDDPSDVDEARARPEVFLTGHRRASIPAWEGDPVPGAAVSMPHVVPQPAALRTGASQPAEADDLRTTVALEVARAEADVLSSRVEMEHAARREAERRLAEAQDELRFLRAEVQMAGHTPRREPGRLSRMLRTVTGRRRPVVPANNPKKERLGI